MSLEPDESAWHESMISQILGIGFRTEMELREVFTDMVSDGTISKEKAVSLIAITNRVSISEEDPDHVQYLD